VYLVIAPTGGQMYTFEDIQAATAEAAVLNGGRAFSGCLFAGNLAPISGRNVERLRRRSGGSDG
jgi:hypothetical protein